MITIKLPVTKDRYLIAKGIIDSGQGSPTLRNLCFQVCLLYNN